MRELNNQYGFQTPSSRISANAPLISANDRKRPENAPQTGANTRISRFSANAPKTHRKHPQTHPYYVEVCGPHLGFARNLTLLTTHHPARGWARDAKPKTGD